MDSILVKIEQYLLLNYQSVIYLLVIVACVCLFSLYYLRWRDYLLPVVLWKKAKALVNDPLPKMSVVVPTNNQVEQLAERLPLLLGQDYPDYEIIVVDEASTDGTKELVEQLQLRFRNLRYTFVPASATEICRRKLAITLGIRAARSEWVAITTPAAVPVSHVWLKTLSESITAQTDIIVGYANYKDNGSHYAQRAVFERLHLLLRCFRSANGYGCMGGAETNFCIRKAAFMAHKGYADNLNVSFGESHLLIDSLSTPLNVSVAVGEKAKVLEDLPAYEVWNNLRCYYREVLHHSSRCAHYYLWREGVASMSLYLFLLVQLAYIGLRSLQIGFYHDFVPFSLIVDLVMLLGLLIYLILPIFMLRQSCKLLGERPFGLRLIGYSLSHPFVNGYLKLKRRKMVRDLF